MRKSTDEKANKMFSTGEEVRDFLDELLPSKEKIPQITMDEDHCCNCQRQKKIDGGSWIYCKWLKYFLANPTFDETGETMGCTKFEK